MWCFTGFHCMGWSILNISNSSTMDGILSEKTLNEMPVGSGVPQGSVLDPLLFLKCINDLSLFITSGCYLLTDDAKLMRLFKDRAMLLEDLQQTLIWTDNCGIEFNEFKCQHHDLALVWHQLSLLPRMEQISDLGEVINPQSKFIRFACKFLSLAGLARIPFRL